MTYSERAKRGTRRQINGQIAFVRSLLSSHKAELKKFKTYRKYKLPGQASMERAARNRVDKTTRDLNMLIARKAKLSKEGKI